MKRFRKRVLWLRRFLKRNQPFAKLTMAVVTLFVGVVGVYVALKQNEIVARQTDIMERQMRMEEQLNEPLFMLEYLHEDNIKDGEIYEDDNFIYSRLTLLSGKASNITVASFICYQLFFTIDYPNFFAFPVDCFLEFDYESNTILIPVYAKEKDENEEMKKDFFEIWNEEYPEYVLDEYGFYGNGNSLIIISYINHFGKRSSIYYRYGIRISESEFEENYVLFSHAKNTYQLLSELNNKYYNNEIYKNIVNENRKNARKSLREVILYLNKNRISQNFDEWKIRNSED